MWCGATETDAAAVDASLTFNPDVFRLSLTTEAEMDDDSFDGISETESEDNPKEGSVFTDDEEEEDVPQKRWNQKYTPQTPCE